MQMCSHPGGNCDSLAIQGCKNEGVKYVFFKLLTGLQQKTKRGKATRRTQTKGSKRTFRNSLQSPSLPANTVVALEPRCYIL